MPIFGLGGMEIAIIAVLILVFFGRGKLQEIARDIRLFADELQGKPQSKVVEVEKEEAVTA